MQENHDYISTLLLDEGNVRAHIVSGAHMVEKARKTHDLSRVATAALGRTLCACALLSADFKHEDDRLSIIVKGNGPLGNIVVTARPPYTVKGYVQNPHIELDLTPAGKLDVGGAVGREGTLTVVEDLGLKTPYVAQVPICTGEIAEDLSHYFAESRQIPNAVYLGVKINADGTLLRASGIFIERMPDCSEQALSKIEALVPELNKLGDLHERRASIREISAELLGDFTVEEIFSFQPLYACDCSEDRLQRVLISLGVEEIRSMVEEQDEVELLCHFCNKKYFFQKEQLIEMLIALEQNMVKQGNI